MSGIEAAFFGSFARDAEAKVSKNGKPYPRFTCRVGEPGEAGRQSGLGRPSEVCVVEKYTGARDA